MFLIIHNFCRYQEAKFYVTASAKIFGSTVIAAAGETADGTVWYFGTFRFWTIL